LKYLRYLLKNREIQLNYKDVEKLNITYRSLYNYSDEDKSAVNDTIRIGWTSNLRNLLNNKDVENLNVAYNNEDTSTVYGEISIIENNEYSTDEEGEYLFKEKSIYLNPGDCIDPGEDSETAEN